MIRSKGRRESEVLAAILAYLSYRKDLVFWRANTSAGLAPSGRFMRSGLKGAADIQGVLFPGQFFSVEVKRERGGKVSEDQKRWGESVTKMGGLYVVARNVEDVEKALSGAPKSFRCPPHNYHQAVGDTPAFCIYCAAPPEGRI